MRIVTIVRRVPDSRAPIRPLADGSGIDAAGLRYVCDPFDEFGVELAVRLREGRSDVAEILALGAGPADVVEVLRFAAAMGADRAAHVPSDAAAQDEILGAALLADAIRREAGGSPDLILCGKQAIDNDSGELGPALAEMLDLPHVGAVTRVEVASDGRSLRAHRRVEGAEEVIETSLPALLTCEKGLVEPRHPPLPRLMKAKKQPVETVTSGDGAAQVRSGVRIERIAPPPGRPPCRFLEGPPETMARELVRLLREEARVL